MLFRTRGLSQKTTKLLVFKLYNRKVRVASESAAAVVKFVAAEFNES